MLQEQLIDIINQHNLRPALLREVYARLEQVAVQMGLPGHMPAPPSPLARDVEEASSPYAQQSPQRSPGQQKQQQQARDVLGRPISTSSGSYPDVLDHDLGHSSRQDQQHAMYSKQQQQHPYHDQQQAAAAARSPDRKPAAPRGGARRDTDVQDVGAPAMPAAALMQAAPLQPQQQRRGGYKVGGMAPVAVPSMCLPVHTCCSRGSPLLVLPCQVLCRSPSHGRNRSPCNVHTMCVC